MNSAARQNYVYASTNVKPFVSNSERDSMTDESKTKSDSILDDLSNINGQLNTESQAVQQAPVKKASSLKWTFVKGGALFSVLMGGLVASHLYFNSDSSSQPKRAQAPVNAPTSSIEANIAAIDAEVDAPEIQSNQSQIQVETNLPVPVRAAPVDNTSLNTQASNINTQTESLTFSDPNSISFAEGDFTQTSNDPYVNALQAMPDANSPASEPDAEVMQKPDIKSADSRIANVMVAEDPKVMLENSMRQVDARFASQEVKIEGSQRAITQTAQLLVELRGAIQSLRKDVVSIRSIAYDNQDSIKALEAKTVALQKKIEQNTTAVSSRTVSEAQPVAKQVVSNTQPNVVAPKPAFASVAPSVSQAQAEPISTPTFQRKAVEISTLTVNATVDNRAAVTHSDGRTYALVKGQRYTNLGIVLEFDPKTNDIYGEFDNGKAWVIRGKK